MTQHTNQSIIIPVHGHIGMARECIASVLRTTTGSSEVIVIDDCSPEPFEPESEDERLRVLRLDAPAGFATACNVGAEIARGAQLIFLNSDTVTEGDWAERLLACGAEHSSRIVGARLFYSDGTIQHAGMCFSQHDGMPRHLYRGFPGDHPAVARDRRLRAVSGACIAVSRTLFQELAGFDTTFLNGFEDVDLCLRAAQHDAAVLYCGSTRITHLESVSLPMRKPPTVENASAFRERWGDTVAPDEFAYYVEDNLIAVTSDDVYPLQFAIDPLLGQAWNDETSLLVSRLLNTRSRQVFDLQKRIGYLTARLLDHGIEP